MATLISEQPFFAQQARTNDNVQITKFSRISCYIIMTLLPTSCTAHDGSVTRTLSYFSNGSERYFLVFGGARWQKAPPTQHIYTLGREECLVGSNN